MIKTRITELFNIEYPVIQAGMVWTSGWKLASAVSDNGCLGLIGAGSMKPDILRVHISKLKKYFDIKGYEKPFGVNIPLIRGDCDELVKVLIDEKIKIVFSAAGNPAKYIDLFKRNEVTVVHVVPSVKHALKAQTSGCDAVVAEGTEAGGHNGVDEITTLCLIPQVADALNIPVIAAGGVADGRQIAACLALGAEGVQIGTRFAASEEASCSNAFKQKIIEAQDNSTILTLKKLTPVRMYRNNFALRADEKEKQCASKEELSELLGKKREMKGIFEGDIDEGELEMGQSSGLVKSVKNVKEIVSDLLKEYNKAIHLFNDHYLPKII
jgi:enoyl-[acyl-carrier protein] reductase II